MQIPSEFNEFFKPTHDIQQKRFNRIWTTRHRMGERNYKTKS